MVTVRRNTKQRAAVLAALTDSADFISAQQLHAQLGPAAPSLATVYRTLQSLVDDGTADTVTRKGEQIYRACGSSHHHHLVCVACGATTEVSGDAIERWAEETAVDNGYRLVSHVAEIYGFCSACSA